MTNDKREQARVAEAKRHDDVHCWLDKTPVPTHNHHNEKFTLLGRVNLLFDWYCDMKAERDTLRAENETLRAELVSVRRERDRLFADRGGVYSSGRPEVD